jgi:hypothetical protein
MIQNQAIAAAMIGRALARDGAGSSRGVAVFVT